MKDDMILNHMKRVTITLPDELVAEIDRREHNRSRFILRATQRELEHQRHEDLRRSLENPHPESGEVAELGLADWASAARTEDDELLDPAAGKTIHWTLGEGWVEESE